MALHTSVADQHFPLAMADPNRLTSTYESFVLIPHLGPVLYSKLYGKVKGITNEVTGAVQLLETVKVHWKEYREIPPTPYLPDDIVVVSGAVADGAAAAGFRIDEAYARPNTRPPHAVLRLLQVAGQSVINTAPVANLYTPDDGRMASYRGVLAGLAAPNFAVAALVDGKQLITGDNLASGKFLEQDTASHVKAIVKSAIDKAGRQPGGRGAAMAETLAVTVLHDNPVLQPHAGAVIPLVQAVLERFMAGYHIVDPADHLAIVESCEWAFVRKERVTMDLGSPRLRGPLALNAVAPASRLTLTETQARVTTTGSWTLLTSQDALAQYNSVTDQVENRLGVLFDYGSNLGQTMSEQGFTQDSMRQEKRSRVESALRELSQRNSTSTMASQTVSTSQIREYRTQGKDPLYATSELAFEAVAPVAVQHHLDDIGAVWAPRVRNPFLDLRANLDAYYQQTYLDYITENYVVDPVAPVPSYESVSRVSRDTTDESTSGTYTKTVTFLLTATEVDTGYRFGEDIQLAFWQHADWYENSYDEDDRWMQIESVDRHGGDSWVDVTVKYHVDDVTGNDPDRHHITVSIDKYKETEAYRQQRQEYLQSVGTTGPARRAAVQAQARKYASLKRDELIRSYESNIDQLKDYAFTSLMRRIFSDVDGNWSYYLGILRTCIDWDRSHVDPEPCDIAALYASQLSPYHFLNVQAVRFFLPINPGAEQVFFETMRNAVDPAWRQLFSTVEDYIADQRQAFGDLPEAQRLLDSYDTEFVLGRHLEGMLSDKTFAES